MDCRSRAHADVYADAAQSSQHRVEALLYVIWLAAGKIPALLLIFTAKSHDRGEAGGWWGGGGGGRAQTDSKSWREKEKKKTSAGDREGKAEERKIKWN